MQPLQSAYTTPVSGEFPTTHHIPHWYSGGDVRRLKIIREIIESYGKDPRISGQAVQILRGSGIAPRDYPGQAQALLEWTQQEIYYVNEPGERLQAPLATLRMGYGDCDDMVILLCSFFESIRLPWKLALAGKDKRTGKLVQYIEGNRLPPGVQWTHIYCVVGNHPFAPKKWLSAEPTLQVPLGWDVVKATNTQHTHALPELGAVSPGGVSGGVAGGTIGAAVGTVKSEWTRILPAIVIGAAVSVFTDILLELVRSGDLYLDWKESHQAARKKTKAGG